MLAHFFLSCSRVFANLNSGFFLFASLWGNNSSTNQTLFGYKVFPFPVDDKESNSSGDGKAKSPTTAASNSSNNSKNVNSLFNDSTTTDKANSTSKPSTPSSTTAPISEQTVTNCAKSADSASEPAAKANNCDLSNDVMNFVIDTTGVKLEIKDDPDAPKVTKSVNNIQPAMGGSLLPPHAASAKHPVSIFQDFPLFASCLGGFMTGSEMLRGWEVSSRKKKTGNI
jgi:hypothetical protein